MTKIVLSDRPDTFEEAFAILSPAVRNMAVRRSQEAAHDPSMGLEDFEQVGYLGLLYAFRAYAPGGPKNFGEYALLCAHNEMTRLRRGAHTDTYQPETALEYVPDSHDADSSICAAEFRSHLPKILRQTLDVLMLGLSVGRAAQACGITPRALFNRRQAIARLLSLYEGGLPFGSIARYADRRDRSYRAHHIRSRVHNRPKNEQSSARSDSSGL